VDAGLGRWMFVSASVVLPLSVVLLSLQHQTGLWPVAALATAAAAAVALAELSARADRAERVLPGRVEHAVQPARAVRLRRLDHS
jgi:hypothetical protein